MEKKNSESNSKALVKSPLSIFSGDFDNSILSIFHLFFRR